MKMRGAAGDVALTDSAIWAASWQPQSFEQAYTA
jgi:hypothetical protein